MTDTAENRHSLTDFVQQLQWREEDGTLTVTPKNQARFLVKMNRAIEILRQAATKDQFQKQFDLLLQVVGEWLRKRNDVRASYLTLRDGALCFVVVRTSAEYDRDFEDELSEFDIQVANDIDLDLIRVTSMSLPFASEEAVASFLAEEFTLNCGDGKTN